MKKRTKIIALSFLGVFFLVIMCFFAPVTPKGGTRLAILCAGYPIEAATTKLESVHIYGNQQSYILSNPPYEKETATILSQWNVSKHGIFYWASYGVV